MANFQGKDASAATIDFAADGAGSVGDPHVPHRKLVANDGVDVGDVTLNGPLGGGAEAGAILVTMANDSTGVLSVDDNGSSITVDGTVDTELTTDDLDTGIGTDTRAVVGMVLAESGGGVLVGSANPLPISAASLPLPAGAATEATLGAIQTAVEILDDWDETNRAAVNLIAAQVGITGGAGAVGANTPRVTLASDDPAVVALQLLDNAISGSELQVDIVSDGAGLATSAGQATMITALQLIDDIINVDDGIYNVSTAKLAAIGMLADETAPDSVGEGDIGVPRMTLDRKQLVRLVGATDGNRADVDGSGNLLVSLEVDNAGLALESGGNLAVLAGWDNAASDGASVSGDVAHDSPDAGEPVKVGYKAISHGSSPTAVAANDRTQGYANLHGVPWVIGGHPNIVTIRANYTAAQTDTAIVTIAASNKIVVTRASAVVDNACSVDVQVRIGFGTATTPTTTGVVLSHPGIAAGSGVVEGSGAGMLGVGADNEDLRITSEVPTGGSLDVVITYYVVPS